MLSQKLGMAAISKEETVRVESRRECSLTAVMTPKGTPINTAAITVPSARVKVTGIFSKRSAKTGWRVRKDTPKSRCIASQM